MNSLQLKLFLNLSDAEVAEGPSEAAVPAGAVNEMGESAWKKLPRVVTFKLCCERHGAFFHQNDVLKGPLNGYYADQDSDFEERGGERLRLARGTPGLPA